MLAPPTKPQTAPTPDRDGSRKVDFLRVKAGKHTAAIDHAIAETPVALVYNGMSFAVMMATPCDLADFALGFALSEGIVASPAEFELVDTLRTPQGVSLQGLIPSARFEALQQRRRTLAGRSGCGLCGMESLEEAVRPPPPVSADARIERTAIVAGMRALAGNQPLNALTGGAHAAGFFASDGTLTVREDVGRHNAVDKLIGALASGKRTPETLHACTARGFLAITSRASWEIVHKAAHAGIAIVAAISAPTSLAIQAAEAAGITLIAFARDESMNVYSHAARVG